MKSAVTLTMAALVLAGGVWAQQAMAQQAVPPVVVPQETMQAAPAQVRTGQPTRSYRSYSVNPTRGEVRRNGQHSGDATWRHAGSKAVGHYGTGR